MLKYYNPNEVPDGIPVNNSTVEANLERMIESLNKDHGYDITREDLKYVIVLEENEIDPIKIKTWMRESLEGQSITVWDGEWYKYHFFFEKENDAMGFKLMWE